MWKDSSITESLQCIASTIVVICWLFFVLFLCDWNFSTFAYFYLVPILVFGWWLVTVTYLQHHSPTTLIYDDEHWKFVDSAFETIDRKYGFGIDYWSHHITDCHVIHHLFFTKIPHYNLYRATEAMKEYLKENNLIHHYRYELTYDFFYKIHYYLISNGLRAIMYNPKSSSSSSSTSSTSPSSSAASISSPSSPASISTLLNSKEQNQSPPSTQQKSENKKKK